MSKAAGRLRLVIRDLMLGLALFLMLSVATADLQGQSLSAFFSTPADARGLEAQPVAPATGQLETYEPTVATARNLERPATMATLAIVFSAMVAINLWFYRHLRRAYASPRRGRWRRD